MNTGIKETNSVIFSLSTLESYNNTMNGDFIVQFGCNHATSSGSIGNFIISHNNNYYNGIFNQVYDVKIKMGTGTVDVVNFGTEVNCFIATETYKDKYEIVGEYGMAITTFMMIIFFWLLGYYLAYKLVLFIDKPAIIDKIKDKYNETKQKIFSNK